MELVQIQDLLKERPNQWSVQQARIQQSNIRFHTDIILNRHESGLGYHEFISWVGSLLKQDKFNRFNQLLQFPNPNNELTDSIYSELSKSLTAEDYIENYIFNDDKAKADWAIYKQPFTKFWQTSGWNEYRRSINSFVVIDWPDEQISDLPNASYFFVNIDNVIDASVNNDNSCNHIIFQSDRGIVAYCDEFLRLLNEDGKLLVEIEHGLGECPARNFWTDTINAKSNINKKAAISGTLSEFNWLLFHRVNKKYGDLSNAYPIVYEYEPDEDESEVDSDDKATAQKGQIKNSGSELAGAGSYKTLPAPTEKDEPDLMKKPIHTEKADVQSLQYNTDELKRLKAEILLSAIGFGGEPANDSAKNEKQIQSGFESREATLINIARNFAEIVSWANDLVCKIRYGDNYVGNFIFGGSKFFLRSESEISDQLNETDSDILKESLSEQLIEVRFKKDDAQKMRAKMINDIDPFAFRSNSEVVSLFEKNLISEEDFQLKEKLFTFVKKFERENAPLTEFELTKTYKERINLIIKTLKSYVISTGQQIEKPQNKT